MSCATQQVTVEQQRKVTTPQVLAIFKSSTNADLTRILSPELHGLGCVSAILVIPSSPTSFCLCSKFNGQHRPLSFNLLLFGFFVNYTEVFGEFSTPKWHHHLNLNQIIITYGEFATFIHARGLLLRMVFNKIPDQMCFGLV